MQDGIFCGFKRCGGEQVKAEPNVMRLECDVEEKVLFSPDMPLSMRHSTGSTSVMTRKASEGADECSMCDRDVVPALSTALLETEIRQERTWWRQNRVGKAQ
jgi:hypothetical protein